MIRHFIKILILAVFVLTGCEFNWYKENYIEREPITPENLQIVFLSTLTDTVMALRTIECRFQIENTPKASCLVFFYLQNKTWNFNTTNGSFMINPDDFRPGIDSLKMSLFFNTGTISEILGFGRLRLLNYWPIVLDHRPPPKLTPYKDVNQNGYLKISWPICDQENFEMYKLVITKGSETWTKYITGKKNNFIVDTLFVGGTTTFNLTTYVSNYPPGPTGTFTIKEQSPAPQFEKPGYDSLKIYWNKGKYKCRYQLTDSHKKVYLTSDHDTTVTIKSQGFGISETYTLTTLPFRSSSYSQIQSKNYVLGDYIESNSTNCSYNKVEKMFYTSSSGTVLCYDIATMTKKKSLTLSGLANQGLFSAPTNSSRIATITQASIYVFPNQTLTNPVIIPYQSSGIRIDHFSLANNGHITIGRSPGFEIINVSTGKKVASARVNHYPYYNIYKSMATSSDGKYLCSVSHLGMNLYRFETDTLISVYSDERAYNSVTFGPDNHLLYLKTRDNFLEIRNAEDFTLIRSVELFSFILCGFDPENGYLLVSDLKWLYILDPVTFSIKLKITCNTPYVNMFAGRLFNQTNYTLNISESL
jgi:hypothetical protein